MTGMRQLVTMYPQPGREEKNAHTRFLLFFTAKSDAVFIKVCLLSMSRLSLIDSLRDLSKRSCLFDNANS